MKNKNALGALALPSAEAADPMIRDLSVGKHPLLLGRLWPTKIHHWSWDELDAFLASNHYPAHTHKDQQEARRQAAINALYRGDLVPQMVLSEDASIAQDAEMKRNSDRFWDSFAVRRKSAADDFEMRIGYRTSFNLYHAKVRELILAMLQQQKPLGVNKMMVHFEGQDLSLRIVAGRSQKMGLFGLCSVSTQQRVVVALGPDSLGVSAIHSLEWDLVEGTLTDLLSAGLTRLDDVWFFTGTGWLPPRPMQIERVADSNPA